MSILNRRTFLRGVGASLSLPLLDAMIPASAAAATAATTSKRAAFIFFPNGAIPQFWNIENEGKLDKLSKTLSPLEKVKDDILVLSGLAHDKARANGDGGGDHARNSASFLTASQPRKTSGADIHLGVSVDQLAAQKIGEATRLPSIELGIEKGRQAGRCDSGYSCAYVSNISWRTPNQPVAKEVNPKLAFERLFGTNSEDAKKQRERDFYRKSILDVVGDDAQTLKKKLGKTDRRKVDEYFTSVRDIETRIERAMNDPRQQIPDYKVPEGVPRDFTEHIKIMYDLMLLAFQTDTTRVASFMLADAGTNRRYTNVDVSGGHHQLSHHRQDKKKVNDIQKIDQYLVTEFARFLSKLKEIPEGDGNLLDNSMIMFGSGISDADRHRHEDLPVILAGKAGGTISTGRHLKYGKNTPVANLFVSMLNRLEVNVDQFGDSTGALPKLDA